MSEDIKNESAEKSSAPEVIETSPVTTETVPDQENQSIPAQESTEQPTDQAAPTNEPEETTQPQIIVQREHDFAHYVGFAILCVLSIICFFIPGIAITFGVNKLATLNNVAVAWIFSGLLSFITWLIFKLKIKGFKKSFYWYIGLSILIIVAIVGIEFVTDSHIFKEIGVMLTTGAETTAGAGVQ